MAILPAHRHHDRRFEHFKYAYPVLSRRARGISIGLNTNPDKACNFDCLYCQVDRSVPAAVNKFDISVAEQELRILVEMVVSGELAAHAPFDSVPREMLRLNDVALSGDGEPTTLANFSAAVEMVARVKPAQAKIVLITDAGSLDRADVKRGLEIMASNRGEIWAKLDAGTEEYFHRINRTAIPFDRILKNIATTAQAWPVVIQSMFLKVNGTGPSLDEVMAYCGRLTDVLAAGGRILGVQACTLARRPMTVVEGRHAWQFVTALSNSELDAIANCVRQRTGLAVESFYGS
jgi:wyosine [tRNA(Phe)-imidazoG37] synthetase (radical SAM superfamily)